MCHHLHLMDFLRPGLSEASFGKFFAPLGWQKNIETQTVPVEFSKISSRPLGWQKNFGTPPVPVQFSKISSRPLGWQKKLSTPPVPVQFSEIPSRPLGWQKNFGTPPVPVQFSKNIFAAERRKFAENLKGNTEMLENESAEKRHQISKQNCQIILDLFPLRLLLYALKKQVENKALR